MTLSVHLFISPNMPPDEEGNIANLTPGPLGLMPVIDVPPQYGEHVLDQVFNHRSGWQHTTFQQVPSIPTFSSPLTNLSRRPLSATRAQAEQRASPNPSTLQLNAPSVAVYVSSETTDESVPLAELSRVPTYGTAGRSRLRSQAEPTDSLLPDYMTAVSGRENQTQC